MTLFQPGLNRTSPWPYTFVLNGTGVMGGTPERQATGYQSFKPEDQSQTAPTSFGYAADNPAFGAVTDYGQFPLGMGLRHQRNPNAAQDLQYDHCLGVDASVYPWVKGPDVTIVTPTSVDSINGVVRFMRIGTTYYAITGRYALAGVASAWSLIQDFGIGKVALDALAFYSNGTGTPLGFVAMGDAENFWYATDGFVWTQHASLKARAFGLTGREFYRAHTTNTLAKVDTDADPTVAGNWGNANAFTIGDKSSGIVRLPTTRAGILLPIKTDGVYSLDEVGDDHLLQPFLTDGYNGRANALWGNHLYVGSTYSGAWRYDEDGSSREQIGPELLTDGSSVVTGQVTACVGTQFALYGAFYNPDSGSSYLCKFLGLTTIEGKPHPTWHGSLTQALPAKVQAMDVQDSVNGTDTGLAAGHTRCYLGFANGQIGHFVLPCKPHPADCSAYRFTTTNGTLRLPTWDGGFGANVKALDAVTVKGRNLSASTYASVATRSDPTGSFAALSDNFDTGQREKVAFATASSATILDTQVTLANTATTASPQVTGLGLHHQVQTPDRQIYEIMVLAENGLRRRDGSPMRIGRDQVVSVVDAAHDALGSVPLVLPDGTSVQIRVKGKRHAIAYEQPNRRPRRAVALECVQVSTNQTTGTYARLEAAGSYAVLEAFTYARLEVF